MPCNTVITNTVTFTNPNMDFNLMEAALRAMFGARVVRYGNVFDFVVEGRPVSFANGRLTSSLSEERLQELTGQMKQTYGKEVVKFAAKRFGWALKFEGTDPFSFQMTKQ